MTKRNVVKEIIAKKARNPPSSRISVFSERHHLIGHAYARLLETADPTGFGVDAEFSRYFPVALVAAVEGYYRQCVADLVNSGGSYPQRAEKIRDLRVNTEVKCALQSGCISQGDHFAHFISIGSLDDVNRILSILVDFDFLEVLLTSEFDVLEDGEPLILREVRAEVVEAARELFQTRHMLCHEFAPLIKPDNAEIIRMLVVSDILVALSEVVLMAEESKTVYKVNVGWS